MTQQTTLFDDDYTGPRYTYGLTLRPLARFHIPDGWIIDSDKYHQDYPRYGVVDYPAELNADQLYRYDLVLVKQTEGN